MIIAITGGRHYKPTDDELISFLSFCTNNNVTLILHGDYADDYGVDRYVSKMAYKLLGIPCLPVPVDHSIDGPWPGAGPNRNHRMLTYSHPVTDSLGTKGERIRALAAFKGNKGTRSAISIATSLNIKVERFDLV